MRVKAFLLSFIASSSLFAGAMTSDEIAKEVMSKNSGKYEISGTFSKYEFSDDSKSNWVFTTKSGKHYQLLGDLSEENIKRVGPFGWKKVDVALTSVDYYAVHYDDSSVYKWLFFSVDESGKCKKIYNLIGQDVSSKGFDYDYNKDGKVETVDMLDCKLNGNEVTFTTFTKDNFEKMLNPYETQELSKGDRLISLSDNAKYKIVTDASTLVSSVTLTDISGLAKVIKKVDPIQNVKDILLLNNEGKYKIAGYFAKYDFGGDEKSNWTFTTPSGNVYQLLGDLSEENIKKNGVFGWKGVDVKPNKPQFYAVKFEDRDFGWVFFTAENGKCKNIYKLSGQAEDGSFLYDIDKDGKIDKLEGIGCSINEDLVEFK